MNAFTAILVTPSAVTGESTPILARAAASRIPLSYYAATCAGFALLFVLPYALLIRAPWASSGRTLALAILAGLINMFLASFLLLSLLRKSSVHVVVPLANTAPFWGVVLSAGLLGEPSSALLFLAGTLVVLGASISFSSWRGMRRVCSGGDVLQALAVGLLLGLSNVALIKLCLERGSIPAVPQVVFVSIALVSW